MRKEEYMLGRLVLLFTLVPLVELFLLIKIGTMIGALPTVLIVVGTGVLGAYLARQQGFQVWSRIQREMELGMFPAEDMLDGLLIFGAGVVLLTPGVITDVIGILILIPFTRLYIREWIKRRLQIMMDRGNVHFNGFLR
jgi:UPF0716 protein FxsA